MKKKKKICFTNYRYASNKNRYDKDIFGEGKLIETIYNFSWLKTTIVQLLRMPIPSFHLTFDSKLVLERK